MKAVLISCAIATAVFARTQDTNPDDLYPLRTGYVRTYRRMESRIGRINKPIEHKIVSTVKRKITITMRKTEVEAFEIQVVDTAGDQKKKETRYAVVGKKDVQVYRKRDKDGYHLLQTYPRSLSKGKSVKLGGVTYQIFQVEIEVPYGKVKGIKLSRKLGYDGHVGGEHIVLARGIGILSHSYDPGGELRFTYFGPKELVSFKKDRK